MVKNYFSDKVVLITGGSSGLGKTFVDYFMKKKATVIVFSRKNKFKKKMYSKKNKFFFYKFDLNHLSKIKLLIKDIIIKFKRIDVLINNAGVAKPQKIESLDEDNLIESFKVNFFAPSLITKEVLKIMKKKNFGRIINISSGGAINCVENYFTYSSSKAALNTLAKTLAKEISDYNIKINSMSPGPCRTKMFPKNKLSTKLSLPTIDYLSSLNKMGPSGKFFWFLNEIDVFPDLRKINWGKPRKLK